MIDPRRTAASSRSLRAAALRLRLLRLDPGTDCGRR